MSTSLREPGKLGDSGRLGSVGLLGGENGSDRNDRDRKLGDFTLFRGHSCNQLDQGLVITQLTMSHQLVKNPLKKGTLFQKEAGESVFQSHYFGPGTFC